MPAKPTADRRKYFRIEDHIGLEMQVLAAGGELNTDPFGDGPMVSLQDELHRLELDLRSQLTSLTERDRLLATVIKTLNNKVDVLARIMAFEQNPLQPGAWQSVTLSEGGVAFLSSDERLQEGMQVAVRLTLPPELYRPVATAEIVEMEAAKGGKSRIHAEFTQIADSDRQQIARHVMRWQIRQRQAQLEQDQPGGEARDPN
ncbi:MAG: PilZ domain-containing protein [Marinobacter sp.]|nr:PilZ domain-containing protein [Marinobacter sp.]